MATINYIRNPDGTGWTAGRIGSGGVMPTNWLYWIVTNGIDCYVQGAGLTYNGVPTVRLRFAGTSGGTAPYQVAFAYDAGTGSAATGFGYNTILNQGASIALVAGSLANVSSFDNWGLIIDSTGATVIDSQTPAAITSTFTRFDSFKTVPSSGNAPFNQAGLASWGPYANAGMVIYPTGIGVAIDFTIDIGGAWLDQTYLASGAPTFGGFHTVASGYQSIPAVGVANFGPFDATGVLALSMLRGVSGSGQTGSPSTQVTDTITLASAPGSGQTGILSTQVDDTITIGSAAGNGQIGIASTQVNATITLIGAAGNGQIGLISTQVNATITLIGAAGSAQIGVVSTQVNDAVTVTGATGSGQIGVVSTQVNDAVTVTGAAGSGQIGIASTQVSDALTVTGAAGSGLIGIAGSQVNATVTLTGAAGGGQLGVAIKQVAVMLEDASGLGSPGFAAPSITDAATISGGAASGQIGSGTEQVLVNLASVVTSTAPGVLGTTSRFGLAAVAASGQAGGTIVLITHSIAGSSGTSQLGDVLEISPVAIAGVGASGFAATETNEVTVSAMAAPASGVADVAIFVSATLAVGAEGEGLAGSDAAQIGLGVVALGQAGTIGFIALRINSTTIMQSVVSSAAIGLLTMQSDTDCPLVPADEARAQAGDFSCIVDIDTMTVGAAASGDLGLMVIGAATGLHGCAATGHTGTFGANESPRLLGTMASGAAGSPATQSLYLYPIVMILA